MIWWNISAGKDAGTFGVQDRRLAARVGIEARDEDQSIGVGLDPMFIQIARDSMNRYQKGSREVIENSE